MVYHAHPGLDEAGRGGHLQRVEDVHGGQGAHLEASHLQNKQKIPVQNGVVVTISSVWSDMAVTRWQKNGAVLYTGIQYEKMHPMMPLTNLILLLYSQGNDFHAAIFLAVRKITNII